MLLLRSPLCRVNIGLDHKDFNIITAPRNVTIAGMVEMFQKKLVVDNALPLPTQTVLW